MSVLFRIPSFTVAASSPMPGSWQKLYKSKRFFSFFGLCCQDGLVPSKTKIDIRGDLAFSRRGEDVPFPAGTARPRGRRYGQQAQLREGSRQGSLWSKHWPCLFCNAAHGEQMEHGPIDLRVTLLTACTREVFCRERPFPVW